MMEEREKVVQGLEYCAAEDKKCFDRRECPYFEAWPMCSHLLVKDALALMKAQEQEISRLKHHVDCDAAEKLPSGCAGYGRGFNDDEPCETCKACEKYNGYGEQ